MQVVWHDTPIPAPLHARLTRVLTRSFCPSANEPMIGIRCSAALAVVGSGALAGFLVVRPCGYVEWLYTTARFRRRGVATSLLRSARARFHQITLHCEDGHSGAEALYARAGFRRTGGVAHAERGNGLPPARMLELSAARIAGRH